ncbi:MAG: DoxX family protein [Bdellovibrionota bacterium]
MNFIELLSRILLATVFAFSGASKLLYWEETLQFISPVLGQAAPLLLGGAAAIEIVGSLMILLGARAKWGAVLLMFYLLPVTFLFHDFWNYQGVDRQMQLIHWMKNLAIMGGLIRVFYHGAGRASLDAYLRQRRDANSRLEGPPRLRRVS